MKRNLDWGTSGNGSLRRPAASLSTSWRRSRPCSKRGSSWYGAVRTRSPSWRSGPPCGGGDDLRDLLPQSVREVIRARLARLSFAASELLRAGAVLERGFGFESLVSVTGLGEAEGLRGLDELIERRLLHEETGGQEAEKPLLYPSATYSFSHEKIRQVAYTEGGPARRQVLHRRAFEVLEGSGAPQAPQRLC